ncbi:MAG TPA: ABC transporter substrate-binding protein [Actinomycetota bacterium]|nr:ABC transporter substrate-binding protein [Actinomycetota bacterium]
MQLSISRRIVPLVAGLALVLAACGGGSGASSSSGSGGTKTFTVGFTSVGMSSAPFLAALDQLRGQGYKIETPELAESELVAEGVAKGRFAFGSGANNEVMTADAKGADLKVIMDRVSNEWTVYARTDIGQCSDLNGKRLAIHSEGAVSTAMVKNYIETKCPGTKPNYVVISGSPNRLAALLADRIDASPLELTDAVTLEAKASDRYHLLASFSKDLPELHPTSIYVNGDFAKKNPETVRAVVKAVLEQNRKVAGDPAYLEQIATKYVPKAVDASTLGSAAKKYVDLKMFDVNGGLTQENLDYTAKFFGPGQAKSVDQDLPASQWSDLSYLTHVVNELGQQ